MSKFQFPSALHLLSIFVQIINTFNYFFLLSLYQNNFLVYQLLLFRNNIVILSLSDLRIPRLFHAISSLTIIYWCWTFFWWHFGHRKEQRWCSSPPKTDIFLFFVEKLPKKQINCIREDLLNVANFSVFETFWMDNFIILQICIISFMSS